MKETGTRDSVIVGKTVLILEDELLVALELSEILKSFGAVVIGPVGRMERARELLATELPNAAVLDVNLKGVESLPFAQELIEAGVVVVLVTGYHADHLPAWCRSLPVLTKPVQEQKLHDALCRALEGYFDGD